MKCNSSEQICDPITVAKILQGFCQSAPNDNKALSKPYKMVNINNSSIDRSENESAESIPPKRIKLSNKIIYSQLSDLNNKNNIPTELSNHESTFANNFPHRYGHHSDETKPRTVTPVSTPVFRHTPGWLSVVGNPEDTVPLIPPMFKCNSCDQDSKSRKMPCLEHIVHLPNHSIKTLSVFKHDELKENGNVVETCKSHMQKNIALWPTMKISQKFGTVEDNTQFHHLATFCRMEGCQGISGRRTPYCKKHSGVRRCEHPACNKYAQGQTRYCIAHGGGRRCCFIGCNKAARDRKFCAAHGGGRRCDEAGCTKIAVGRSKKCTAHGGGRRCQFQNCDKAAQSSSNFCVKHGGGKKCSVEGCCKVARGRTSMCMAHGRLAASQEKMP